MRPSGLSATARASVPVATEPPAVFAPVSMVVTPSPAATWAGGSAAGAPAAPGPAAATVTVAPVSSFLSVIRPVNRPRMALVRY